MQKVRSLGRKRGGQRSIHRSESCHPLSSKPLCTPATSAKPKARSFVGLVFTPSCPCAARRMASISCALSARLFRSPAAPGLLGTSDQQGVLAPREQAPEVPIKGDQVLAGLRHR